MAEETQQDSQKTIVSFVVGLLIGGMLVWAFSGPTADAPPADAVDETNTEANVDDESTSAEVSTDDAEGPTTSETTSAETEPQAQLPVGDGSVVVSNQPAGMTVALESATFPVSEGWIGVRDYQAEQLGLILGVVRFSESQGLVPDEILLQRATAPGRNYAVVIYTEDGDFEFNLANDVQIDEIFATFTAE